jgi:hypothetical protein
MPEELRKCFAWRDETTRFGFQLAGLWGVENLLTRFPCDEQTKHVELHTLLLKIFTKCGEQKPVGRVNNQGHLVVPVKGSLDL